MGTVIFVGGATASGKSTLVKELNTQIPNSQMYRRYQGFFDIAKEKGISNDEIFNQVESYEVDDWFVNKCCSTDVLISDVHYAVQMNRDVEDQNVNIYQAYVGTISDDLIQKLLASGIEIIAIHLSCSPNTCLKRAKKRFNNHEKGLRAKSLLDVELENNAEKREWLKLCSISGVKSLELNSDLMNSNELVDCCLDILSESTKKTLCKRNRKPMV